MTAAKFNLAALAGTWCQRADFQRWCGAANAGEARAIILTKCSITSRRELDTDEHARRAFNEHFRRPFAAYLEEHTS